MSEERRKRQQERDGSVHEAQSEEDPHLWRRADPAGGRIHRGPVLQESQIRFFRQMPGDASRPRCTAFTGVRTASNRKRCLAKRFTTCPTWSARSRAQGTGACMQDRRSETVSQLAVWNGAAEGRSVVSGSLERQDRVQPAVTDRRRFQLLKLRPARSNRVLFASHRGSVAGGCDRVGGFAAAPLCEVGDCVLRFQPEVQLRHREPQRVFDHAWEFPWRRSALPGTPRCSSCRHSGSRAPKRQTACWRGDCRIGLCPLPHLHRSLRTDDLVHFVPDLAAADFSDQLFSPSP